MSIRPLLLLLESQQESDTVEDSDRARYTAGIENTHVLTKNLLELYYHVNDALELMLLLAEQYCARVNCVVHIVTEVCMLNNTCIRSTSVFEQVYYSMQLNKLIISLFDVQWEEKFPPKVLEQIIWVGIKIVRFSSEITSGNYLMEMEQYFY